MDVWVSFPWWRKELKVSRGQWSSQLTGCKKQKQAKCGHCFPQFYSYLSRQNARGEPKKEKTLTDNFLRELRWWAEFQKCKFRYSGRERAAGRLPDVMWQVQGAAPANDLLTCTLLTPYTPEFPGLGDMYWNKRPPVWFLCWPKLKFENHCSRILKGTMEETNNKCTEIQSITDVTMTTPLVGKTHENRTYPSFYFHARICI